MDSQTLVRRPWRRFFYLGSAQMRLLQRHLNFIKTMTAIMSIALLLAAIAPGRAEMGWPTRRVTLIVPYTAGGFSDVVARLLADFYSQKFGQPFVVDNRPGGNGVVGASFVANSAPDGYTLLLASAAQVISVPLLEKVSYDPDSLVPVSNIAGFPYLLAIASSLPPTNLEQFVAYAKANPGKLNFGSAGVGSMSHIMAAMFISRADINVVHIPYKSANPATEALVAGQVDMVFIGAAELIPQLNNDKVRILATAAAKRLPMFPNVPAVGESYPGLEFETWNGLMVPRGTPQEIIDRLAQATQEATRSPTVLNRMSNLNIIPLGTTPAEFSETLKRDKKFFPEAIKAAGLKSEL